MCEGVCGVMYVMCVWYVCVVSVRGVCVCVWGGGGGVCVCGGGGGGLVCVCAALRTNLRLQCIFIYI